MKIVIKNGLYKFIESDLRNLTEKYEWHGLGKWEALYLIRNSFRYCFCPMILNQNLLNILIIRFLEFSMIPKIKKGLCGST